MQLLRKYRDQGTRMPKCSVIAQDLKDRNPKIFEGRAKSFTEYYSLAVTLNLIEVGGQDDDGAKPEWVRLSPAYVGI
jgi:hypothetical protein